MNKFNLIEYESYLVSNALLFSAFNYFSWINIVLNVFSISMTKDIKA